jgi:hypothetical protein
MKIRTRKGKTNWTSFPAHHSPFLGPGFTSKSSHISDNVKGGFLKYCLFRAVKSIPTSIIYTGAAEDREGDRARKGMVLVRPGGDAERELRRRRGSVLVDGERDCRIGDDRSSIFMFSIFTFSLSVYPRRLLTPTSQSSVSIPRRSSKTLRAASALWTTIRSGVEVACCRAGENASWNSLDASDFDTS